MAPIIVDTIPPDLNLECIDDVPPPESLIAIDNCSGIITVNPSINIYGDPAKNDFTEIRTWTFTDTCGNSSSVSQTIVVLDDIPPSITCPEDKIITNDFGQTTAEVFYDVLFDDNCSGATLAQTSGLGSGANFPIGVTTEAYVATDVAGNTQGCSFTITVEKRPVTINYTGDTEEQYSDETNLSATLLDGINGNPIANETLTFTIGSQSVNAITNGSGVASTTLIIDQAPGNYNVVVEFAGNDQYKSGQSLTPFEITQEDANTYYTGSTFVSTGSKNSGSATIFLSATIEDINDANRGDIINADVYFVDRDGGDINPSPLTVSLISSTLGTVTYSWTVDIGNNDAEQFVVGIRVDNYYFSNDPVEDVIITVAKALGTKFITGGGYLVLCCSEGSLEGQVGTKSNFGFNIKYNKKGTNLQGNIRLLFRRYESDGLLHTYQIKGNNMISLSVSDNYAEFTGKANIQDVTDPYNVVSVLGNGEFLVKMTDNGEPGTNDNISLTFYNKNGGLVFTSNWNGFVPILQNLDGGNLQVQDRGGNNSESSKVYIRSLDSINESLEVKIFPNPASNYINLVLDGYNPEKAIIIQISDIHGRVILHQKKEFINDESIKLELPSYVSDGLYYVNIQNDNKTKLAPIIILK